MIISGHQAVIMDWLGMAGMLSRVYKRQDTHHSKSDMYRYVPEGDGCSVYPSEYLELK